MQAFTTYSVFFAQNHSTYSIICFCDPFAERDWR